MRITKQTANQSHQALSADGLDETQAFEPYNSEHEVQNAIVAWLASWAFVVAWSDNKRLPDLEDALTPIVLRANSGLAFDRSGKRRIALAPAGTPDLLVFLPGGKTMFVEVKFGKAKAKAKPVQLEMHECLRNLGFLVVVASGIGDVETAVIAAGRAACEAELTSASFEAAQQKMVAAKVLALMPDDL